MRKLAYIPQGATALSEGTHPEFAKETKGRGVPTVQQIRNLI
jgi:hypothetical protein